jgi:hypothetical protein
VIVKEGVYSETVWEISGRSISFEGEGKSKTIVKVALQNSDTFISCELGILFLSFCFYFCCVCFIDVGIFIF